MTIDELKNSNLYEVHHTAYAAGYVSRKGNGYIKKYNGRFGSGYTLHESCYISTRFHYITYYILK